MTTLVEIKSRQLAARKAGLDTEKNLLTTLIGEIETELRKPGAKPEAEVVSATVKSFLKKVNEFAGSGVTGERLDSLNAEKAILESFLPKQLSRDDLFNKLTVLANDQVELGPKFKGTAMKFLKDNFPNQYDGKDASQIVEEIINAA